MSLRLLTGKEWQAQLFTELGMAQDALARARDGLSVENVRCHDLGYCRDQLARALKYVARLQLLTEAYEVADAIYPAK